MNDQKSAPQSVLVIDDHVLFRDGLISLLESTADFHVVDQAGTVSEGIEKAFHHRPDIILMDFSLPDGTGLDATKIILDEIPECKIVFLTVFETDENLLKAIRLGAKGYMLKNISSSSLLASLRALAKGEIAMSRKMMSRVVEYSRAMPVPPSEDLLAKLSPRELDILSALQDGASNTQIARQLYLSENTVKHHIHNILEKLGVENRRQASVLAKQMGLKRGASPSASK
ncbi:MAG: response regulator [Chloroflexota bacterium]|nr:response regulator transcription factor [Chloroflexota bacterium]MBI5702566.1 response regulator transcription factor [Chloroflexota bacterium]